MKTLQITIDHLEMIIASAESAKENDDSLSSTLQIIITKENDDFNSSDFFEVWLKSVYQEGDGLKVFTHGNGFIQGNM